MRHIPEEELHAYLDQGLSRSQCVEIESHLAGCASCQAARDGIAALRDRTTALLAKLVPPRSCPAPFETLRRRAVIEASVRRRRMHMAAWAASVVAALALGWTGSYLTVPGATARTTAQRPTARPIVRPAQAAEPIAPTAVPAIVRPARPASVAARQLRRAARTRSQAIYSAVLPAEPAMLTQVIDPPALELSSLDIPRTGRKLEFDGMWRTMSWVGAQAEAGDQFPHIDGLPVVQVQVQSGKQGSQPLMVVAQQLASGEVIRTIEGPATDVSHLLAGRAMSDPYPTGATTDSSRSSGGPDHIDRTMAMQRGDRMLAITGALPSDSLLAMIRRLNAEMRSK